MTGEKMRQALYEAEVLRHAAQLNRLATVEADNERFWVALMQIAKLTNADDPQSYRADDCEGCLDTVQTIARAALSGDPK